MPIWKGLFEVQPLQGHSFTSEGDKVMSVTLQGMVNAGDGLYRYCILEAEGSKVQIRLNGRMEGNMLHGVDYRKMSRGMEGMCGCAIRDVQSYLASGKDIKSYTAPPALTAYLERMFTYKPQ